MNTYQATILSTGSMQGLSDTSPNIAEHLANEYKEVLEKIDKKDFINQYNRGLVMIDSSTDAIIKASLGYLPSDVKVTDLDTILKQRRTEQPYKYVKGAIIKGLELLKDPYKVPDNKNYRVLTKCGVCFTEQEYGYSYLISTRFTACPICRGAVTQKKSSYKVGEVFGTYKIISERRHDGDYDTNGRPKMVVDVECQKCKKTTTKVMYSLRQAQGNKSCSQCNTGRQVSSYYRRNKERINEIRRENYRRQRGLPEDHKFKPVMTLAERKEAKRLYDKKRHEKIREAEEKKRIEEGRPKKPVGRPRKEGTHYERNKDKIKAKRDSPEAKEKMREYQAKYREEKGEKLKEYKRAWSRKKRQAKKENK